MKNLKKYAKYVIWLIAFTFFTNFLIFIGFNGNYKSIALKKNVSEQIIIDKAESAKSRVRIYGKVKNTETSNLNGKYLEVKAYNDNDKLVTTEYLKIENLKLNEEKDFQIKFSAKDIKKYEINIIKK